MDRRRFLGSVAAATAVAGCTSGGDSESDSTERDSDDDGVPDSEDYAPKDPDVQEKADLNATTTKRTAETTTATTTQTTATTTTQTTATTTTTTTQTTAATATTESALEDEDANTLTAGSGWSDSESHITAYSSRSVTARVAPGGPDVSADLDGESVKVLAFAYRYPRSEAVTYATSDPVTLDGTTEITTSLDLSDADVASGERLHYLGFLMPGDDDVDSVASEDLEFFHETDAFELRDDGVTIDRSPGSDELGDDSKAEYEREAVEGAYVLTFEGSTQGQSWTVNFYIYKSSYAQAVAEPRGRSRPEYVAYAQEEGFAGEIAGILDTEADENGFSNKRAKVEFVIDFVQNLPYVPDDVSKGFDDYTKFITETITEAGGDCEDTAIMLAAVLQSEPFGYDTVLIQPPGHMAAGIYGSDDLEGHYWEYEGRRYYYIETTGKGWGIGDLPDTYQGEDAYVYQV